MRLLASFVTVLISTISFAEQVTLEEGTFTNRPVVKSIYVEEQADGSRIIKDKEVTEFPHTNVMYDPNVWRSNCRKDRFDNTKTCTLSKDRSDLIIMLINGKTTVYVGGNHYPRSQSALKIDNNPTIYGNEGSSNNSQKTLSQLKSGKTAYTRYKKWPYEYNQDGETDLTGFTEAYEKMLEEYRKL